MYETSAPRAVARELPYIVSKFDLYIKPQYLEQWIGDYPILFLSMGYPLLQEGVSNLGPPSDITSLSPNRTSEVYAQINNLNHSGQVAKLIKVRQNWTPNYGRTK